MPLNAIKRNADELRELIDNLLDLSKIEAGKIPASMEPVDLKRLLPATFENIKPLINGKKIEVEWKIQEDLKIIQSDPLKIRQVFLNLISNAIKFTEQGTMTVSARNAEKGIRLSVEDTGVGIKEEDLSIIFDPFLQIEGPLTQKMGGSGLGLTIVKNTVEALCGKIEVRSIFGKGSTFTVFFPESLDTPLKPTGPHQKLSSPSSDAALFER
jgi:signal transduction histidine kinase